MKYLGDSLLKANKHDTLYLLEVNTVKIAYMCVSSTDNRAKSYRNFDNKMFADVVKFQYLGTRLTN
jgi:hypothetical protein